MTPENHRSATQRGAVESTTCAPPAQAQTVAITNRPRRSVARSATGEGVPSTVWAPPSGAIGVGWRAWVIDAVTRAFLPPRGRWIDMTDHLGTRPTDGPPSSGRVAPTGGRRGGSVPAVGRYADGVPQRGADVVPFWAALIDASSVARQPIGVPSSIPISSGRGDVVADTGADLVFVDLGDAEVDDRLGVLAARALRAGGILAVLTRCRHSSAVRDASRTPGDVGEGLIDRTGTVVASAQNADLLYLQHVVIPTRPLTPPSGLRVDRAALAPAEPAGAPESADSHGNPVHRWRRHAIEHADLLVFALPPSRGPRGPGVEGSGGVTGSDAGTAGGA